MFRTICMPGVRYTTNILRNGELVKVETFPDGETALVVPHIDIKDKIVLIGHCADAQASESFLAAAYEIAAQSPETLTVVNTYFRHARSERAVTGRAALAKFQARQWSGLGRLYPGIRLVFVDLHKDLILNYFEGAVATENVSLLPTLEKHLLQDYQEPLDNLAYAAVDEGGVHALRAMRWRQPYLRIAYIEKHRVSGEEIEIRRVMGDPVEGKDVVIFDDIISTGESLVKAAEAYKAQGARSVRAAVVHGVFVGKAVEKIEASCLDTLLVTDTHPNAIKVESKKIQVLPAIRHLAQESKFCR